MTKITGPCYIQGPSKIEPIEPDDTGKLTFRCTSNILFVPAGCTIDIDYPGGIDFYSALTAGSRPTTNSDIQGEKPQGSQP